MNIMVAAMVLMITSEAFADGGVVRGTVSINRAQDALAAGPAPQHSLVRSMSGPAPQHSLVRSMSGPVIVYLVGFSEKPSVATVEIQQIRKAFVPELQAIVAGQSVSFPNSDPFLHNVFSPTLERRFDIGSFKKGESRSRMFPTPGVIDVYCNIHPEMSATLLVLPNSKFAVVDADGTFELRNVPPGTWTLFAYSRRSSTPVSAAVTVKIGEVSQASLVLTETPKDFQHVNKFGEAYRNDIMYKPGS
jgi:plastocyanin